MIDNIETWNKENDKIPIIVSVPLNIYLS